ncbi:MAG: class I SAM-dependent methyltransferase [Spirochaetales bacterium]
MSGNVLVIPDTRRGHGSGHLMRAARLVGDINRFPDASARLVVDFPWGTSAFSVQDVDKIAGELGAKPAHWDSRGHGCDLFVVDAQDMQRNAVCELSLVAPVVGIDLGGEGRSYADYLIDTMPNLEEHAPNRFDPGLNHLPERVRFASSPRSSESDTTESHPSRGVETQNRASEAPPRVLIATGGEDPAGLTRKLLDAIERVVCLDNPGGYQVDVAVGCFSADAGGDDAGDFVGRRAGSCIGDVVRTDRLSEKLGEYEVVITTFGLTSYEALAAGCTVLHVAPTSYHAALSERSGIPLAGETGTVDGERLLRLLADHHRINRQQEPLRPARGESLADAIVGLRPAAFQYARLEAGQGCEIRPEVVARFCDRTFRNGRSILYLQRFSERTIDYNERYFFDEYKAQYGRSYLEDFEHITDMCRKRVRRIEKMRRAGSRDTAAILKMLTSPRAGRSPAGSVSEAAASRVTPVLVDLGCAYGPMLRAAAEAGYIPYGVDYFEGAVDYVRNTLGYEAVQGDILDPATVEALGLRGQADVVSMWYVIEHVRDLSALFAVVHTLLKPGGVFAFSTPNAGGGSARRDLHAFLRQSPEDHWSIWDARRTPRLLRRRGFSQCRVRVTGHHPERFAPRLSRSKAGIGIMHRYSRLRGLGDTFEAYARKD